MTVRISANARFTSASFAQLTAVSQHEIGSPPCPDVKLRGDPVLRLDQGLVLYPDETVPLREQGYINRSGHCLGLIRRHAHQKRRKADKGVGYAGEVHERAACGLGLATHAGCDG